MLNILSKLVSAQSISPNDAGLMEYIEGLLSEHGFNVAVKEFGSGPEATRNLYAEYGTHGANLCFAGHVDVVPPGDISLWQHDPFALYVQDNIAYGRGVVDMKGAVAAMLHAGILWSKENNAKISFLLTSDEEASGKYGTKIMLEWMKDNGKQIDFAIIGEPTSAEKMGDIIKIGRRGSINFKIIVKGKQGHTAYPLLAKNPNHILVSILHELISYKIDEGSSFFDKSNLEISSIDVGNRTSNIIPNKAEARFNIRYADVKKAEDIIGEIKNLISEYTEEYELEYDISARAFLARTTDFTKKIQEIVNEECGLQSQFSTSGGTSDARFIQDYCPLLEFGLLNKTAHHINEHAEIMHLQTLSNVYYRAIKSFHGV